MCFFTFYGAPGQDPKPKFDSEGATAPFWKRLTYWVVVLGCRDLEKQALKNTLFGSFWTLLDL